MTTTATGTAPRPLAEAAGTDHPPRQCAARDCDQAIPPDAHPQKKYHDAACRRREARKRRQSGPSRSTSRKRHLHQALASLASWGHLADPVCFGALAEQCESIADALDQLADQHPSFARGLELAMSGGGWLSLAVALAPVGKAVYDHHLVEPADEAEADPSRNGQTPRTIGDLLRPDRDSEQAGDDA